MSDSATIITGKRFISVEEAEEIILSQKKDFGTETICFQESIGRVLAQEITADRDLPPFNRVAMDGIAICYEALGKGMRSFKIKGVQSAGEEPIHFEAIDECIEIMTGAALPSSADTIIRYEDIKIENGKAILQIDEVKKGQNIHWKGSDKKQGKVLVNPGCTITPSVISVAASVGAIELLVKKLPKIVVISTGDEIVDVEKQPSAYQIRNSNKYCIDAVLKTHSLQPKLLHLPDDADAIKKEIEKCLEEYDVLIVTGGVSMGKFDHIPKVMEELSVRILFYKVQQRPGKPFWFGSYKSKLIFAFPGNPVSAFLCLQRYFLPWLKSSLSIVSFNMFAALEEDIGFKPSLTHFLQVKLQMNNEGKLLAQPIKGNGSGDFSSLVDADAFLELPADKTSFHKGEVYRVWLFKNYF